MCPGSDDIQHVARTKGLQLFCVGGGALWMRVSSGFPSSAALSKMWFFFETVHVLTVQNFFGTFLLTCHTIVSWNYVEMVLKPSHQSSHPHAKVHMLWQDLLERCKISHPFFFFLHNFFNSYCVFLKKEVSRGNPFTVVAAVPFYWLGINIRKGKAVWGLWEELVLNIWLTS